MNFRELIPEHQGAEQQQQVIEQDFHFGANLQFSMSPSSDFKLVDRPFNLDSSIPKSTSTIEMGNISLESLNQFQTLQESPEYLPSIGQDNRSRSTSPTVPSLPSAKRNGPQVVILSPAQMQQMVPTPPIDPANTKVFPDEQTYFNYLKRRQNNNAAATKSRQKKKQLEIATLERAKLLEEENAYLKQELQKLQVETRSLKEVLQALLAKK